MVNHLWTDIHLSLFLAIEIDQFQVFTVDQRDQLFNWFPLKVKSWITWTSPWVLKAGMPCKLYWNAWAVNLQWAL